MTPLAGRGAGLIHTGRDAGAALAEAAELGGFFVLETGPIDPDWRSWSELLGRCPDPLDQAVARVRDALGGPDRVRPRVAASIMVQGLAARVLSAPLATLAARDLTPLLTPASLHWRVDGAGWRLRLPAGVAAVGAVDAGGGPLGGVLDGMLAPLLTRVHDRVSVSDRVLRGNVASALAGAKRVLGTARPELAERLAALTRDVLRHPLLAGTGDLGPPVGPDVGWSFRRRSCCLYYQVSNGATCADCVLGR